MILYRINTGDFFKARSEGFIPEDRVLEAGSLWIIIRLTEDEASKYPYPICKE